MQGITRRIFFAVIAMSVIGFVCFIIIFRSMESITYKYSSLLDGYVENRQIMSEINQDMYNLQAQVASHVVNTDKQKTKKYEKKVAKIDSDINSLFEKLQDRLKDEDEKQVFRQVTTSYSGLWEQTKIALKFSREGATKSAEYYVCTVMDGYLQDANDAFEAYYEKTKVDVTSAKEEMEAQMSRVHIERDIAAGVVGVVLLACLIFVYRSGQTIVDYSIRETDENNNRILDMQYKTIVGMANLIESRDGETGEHVKRTSAYASMIAEELSHDGLYQDQITNGYMENLWKSAPLHDIGKIIVSDTILQKPGKLTKEEFEKIKLHASEGGKIIDETLGGIDDDAYLDMAHKVARYHHEKWDGTGYPEGLKGQEIPLCARIMAVADVFDALVSKRCYKKAMTLDEAYQIIKDSSGTHFDPIVADAFLRIRPKVESYIKDEEEI